MPGTYVVVRLPSHGTLLGDMVARHPGSQVSCVLSGRHEHDGRPVLDHLALIEGLPDAELAALLMGWKRLYGEAPQVLGGPFALRLPVALDRQHDPTVALCLRLGEVLPGVSHRLYGGVVELWGRCETSAEAAAQGERIRRTLAGLPILSIDVAQPSAEDIECWDLLRAAADEVLLDCLAVAS